MSTAVTFMDPPAADRRNPPAMVGIAIGLTMSLPFWAAVAWAGYAFLF